MKQITLPGHTVKKSNDIARARIKSGTAIGYKVAAVVASKIRKTDEDFFEYEITTNLLTPYNTGSKNYKSIERQMDEIATTIVSIKERTKYKTYPVFGRAEYDTETRKAIVTLNPELKEHFLQLQDHFTMIPLFEYMRLSSIYSQKLYEYLKSWCDLPEQAIAINDLHEMLGTKPFHRKNYTELSRKILQPAWKQITGKTSFLYEWEPTRYKGKVTFIRFVFSKERMAQLKIKLAQEALEKKYKSFEKSLAKIDPAILADMPWTKNRKSAEYDANFQSFLEKKEAKKKK